MTESNPDQTRSRSIGVAQALGAYLWWGLMTGIYFKSLDQVSPLELLAWRVLAGLPVVLVLLVLPPGLRRVRVAIRSRADFGILVVSTLLITINWLTFIYAVVADRLVEASLGYFVNPIVTVLLGRFVLGERLQGRQLAAVWLASLGVLVFGIAAVWGDMSWSDEGPTDVLALFHRLPWIACVLPLSFGAYGLLRKRMTADSITGLSIEMTLLFPFMLAIEVILMQQGHAAFRQQGIQVDLLLLVGGIVTATPLLLFAAAARRLRLATLGQLQYIAPTCQFLLAVLIFKEPIDAGKLAGCSIIWFAVALYSWDSIRNRDRVATG